MSLDGRIMNHLRREQMLKDEKRSVIPARPEIARKPEVALPAPETPLLGRLAIRASELMNPRRKQTDSTGEVS